MDIWMRIPGMDAEMERVEAIIREYYRDFLGREPISTIMETALTQKGKRIRPALVLLSARLDNKASYNSKQLCRLAAIVEMAHAASLIHDDIVDDSPLRRGKPTVQARFGKDMAVYAGDFILSRILCELMGAEMIRSGKIIAKCMSEMCCGELAQYEAQFDTEATEENYFASIIGKTGALFSVCCEVGALESGCAPETARLMRRFGRDLGILFQLRDDLLDYTSSARQEGKPMHSDFKRGIYTLPVLYSFRDPKAGRELKELALRVRGGDRDGALCRRMEELVEKSGGIMYTEQIMDEYAARARSMLRSLPDSQASKSLNTLVCFLLPRREALESVPV